MSKKVRRDISVGAVLVLIVAAIYSSFASRAQQFFPPTSGGLTVVTTLPATCTAGSQYLFNGTIFICNPVNTLTQIPPTYIATNGLIGDYQMLPGETVASLPDHSSAGNNATTTVGTAPTITAITGGLSCAGNGAVILPTALNGTLTWVFFLGFQPPQTTIIGINQYNAPVMGNGNGAASNAAGLVLYSSLTADAWGPDAQGLARLRSFSTNAFQAASLDAFVGNHTVTWTLSTLDHLYIDNHEVLYTQTLNPSAGVNTFPFQLCGTAAGSGSTNQTYFTGTIYRALAYNRVITAAELAQDVQALQQGMAARGVATTLTPTDTQDQASIRGDSISVGLGWPVGLSLYPTTANWNVADQGQQGDTLLQSAPTIPTTVSPLTRPLATHNVSVYWAGTNDAGLAVAHFPYMVNSAQQIRASGSKVIVATMISRTNEDGNKNQLNALIRSQWPQFADGMCDFAANPNVGADGASANATYFTDGIHLTATGSALISGMASQCINRLFGNTQASGNFTTVKVAATMKPMFRVPANKVQHGSQGAGTTLTAVFPVNPLGKSLLVGDVIWNNTVTITGVADTSGDTCAAIGSPVNYFSTQWMQMWYCQNVTAAAQTVTVTLSGGGTGAGGYVAGVEVLGILNTAGPVDLSSAYATGNSGSPLTAAITTTVAGDFLMAAGVDFGHEWTPNTNYNLVWGTQDGASAQMLGDSTDGSATGSYTAGYTTPGTSNLWAIGLTAFKPAVYFSPYNMTQMDVYTQVDPSGGAVVLNMIDAVGISGQTVTIQNIGTNSVNQVSLTPLGSETINGVTGASSFIIPNGTTAICTSVLVSPTAAGANWKCVISPSVVISNHTGAGYAIQQIVSDTGTLAGGTLAVTFTNAFSAATAYQCIVNDTTTPANAITVTYTSASVVTFAGTGTDALKYSCFGH